MTRAAYLRTLAMLPLATVSLSGAVARAEDSGTAPSSKQTDSKKNAQQQPKQTPAQERYGLPRNPIIGSIIDPDLGQPLSLERAVQIGLQRQNSIAISAAQIESANARLTQARSQYFPQIGPSLQYQTNLSAGQVFNGISFPGTSNETRTDLITVRQLIWDTGIRENNVGSTRRNVFAAEYGLGDQRQSVILAVTEGYFNLGRSKELVRVQEESVRRAETNLEVIKAQVAAQVAAQSDTLQAEADLANARIALLSAQSDYNVAQANLKNAMGIVSSQPIQLAVGRLPAPTEAPDTQSIDDYVKLAYNTRLDLKRQQELIHAQGYTVRSAITNNGITVNANISQGYQFDPGEGEIRTFTVAFAYPLFDAGNTRAAVRDAKATLEIQRRNLDLLQQTVRLNVEQAYLVREVARQRIASASLAVRASELNYQVALEKQKNGLINILDVITAQVQLVNAQVAQVQALYDFYIADARLRRNIGVNDPEYRPRIPGAKPVRASLATPGVALSSLIPGASQAPAPGSASPTPTEVANGRKP